jgi:acyl-CoA synthetase (AMP-forming)/AMP-acid ligase II
MTVRLVPERGLDAAARTSTSLLDLLDDAATGHGTVHFVGQEVEPSSIGTLWDESEQAARWIADRTGAGGTVATVLTNTRACASSLFGAWRAGCTVASLPLPARGMTAESYLEQLTRFCEAAGATTLLLDPEHAALLGDAALPVHTFDETAAGGPAGALGDADAGSLVQFTSGSVGTPKGIQLSLDAVGAHVLAILALLAVGDDAGESSCSWLPLSHDMGLIGQLLSPLAAGAPRFGHHSLTLMKPETFIANPRSWLQNCSACEATVTVAPNFALELSIRTAAKSGAFDLSHLRTVIVGSEAVHADTLERFAAAFDPMGFDPLAFCPAYGMAEATLAVTIVKPSEPWRAIPQPGADGAPDPSARPLVCTGSALDGVDVRVDAPPGAVGTIQFRSGSMLSRYIGADLTLTDDGYFVTGDLGLIDDGELFVIGRGDEVIVVAGRNLYPADLEAAVKHEAVRGGCAAAVAAPDGGFAIVVEPSAANAEPADLEDACRGIRAMVASRTGNAPATVAFVPRGSLPKTPSGKLRRLQIRKVLHSDDGILARKDFG